MLYINPVGDALLSCNKKNAPTTKKVPAIPTISNKSAITRLSFALKNPNNWPYPWGGYFSIIETAKPREYSRLNYWNKANCPLKIFKWIRCSWIKYLAHGVLNYYLNVTLPPIIL